MLISEAKLSSSIALAVTPVILVIVVFGSWLFGLDLEDGIYYRAFGPAIYLVFLGGLAYAFYEFTKIFRGRLYYLTYHDGCIHVLEQEPIRLDKISSVTIERKLFLKNLVIRTSGGGTVRIRGYLLQRNLNDVKNSIEALQQSESA